MVIIQHSQNGPKWKLGSVDFRLLTCGDDFAEALSASLFTDMTLLIFFFSFSSSSVMSVQCSAWIHWSASLYFHSSLAVLSLFWHHCNLRNRRGCSSKFLMAPIYYYRPHIHDVVRSKWVKYKVWVNYLLKNPLPHFFVCFDSNDPGILQWALEY